MPQTAAKTERRLTGLAASPGIVHARALVHQAQEEIPVLHELDPGQEEAEIKRFEAALIATRQQITALQIKVVEQISEAEGAIFDAHLLVTEDPALVEEVETAIRQKRWNAEYAVGQTSDRHARMLAGLDDQYLRERAIDVQDVGRRIVRNLLGKEGATIATASAPHILVAHDLTPSDTAQLHRDLVLGFITETGSKTSHTAILARSAGVPALVGVHDAVADIETGDELLLDGYSGTVFLHPSAQTLYEYGKIESQRRAAREQLDTIRDTDAVTRDGRRIILSANIETPDDVDEVLAAGAEGVGLFRTEFLFLGQNQLPTEDQQAAAYARVASALAPAPCIIRTLDLGGDKLHESLNLPGESNPFLGLRAVRLCLERDELFKTQLRAILRASVSGNVSVMFPMISSLHEFRRARAVFDQCRDELRAEGVPVGDHLPVGAMIEIPSAALTADLIAQSADFLSVGTNDLIQYTIAVDRMNERISHLYEPTHPAVLRLLRHIVSAARDGKRWSGVCGEMGGDVLLTPLLVGLGFDELSVGAASVPRVKRAIQTLDFATCQRLADEALALQDPAAILEKCDTLARTTYPELL